MQICWPIYSDLDNHPNVLMLSMSRAIIRVQRRCLSHTHLSRRFKATFANLGELSAPALCAELRLRGVQALPEEDEDVLKRRLRYAVSGTHFEDDLYDDDDDVDVRLLANDLGLLASRGVTVLPRQIYAKESIAEPVSSPDRNGSDADPLVSGSGGADHGVEAFLSSASEPVLLASSNALNPTKAWSRAIKAWNDPTDDLFLREFEGVGVGLRDVNEVARGGGLPSHTRAQLDNPFWSGAESQDPYAGVATLGDLSSERARWLLGFGGKNRHDNPRSGGSVVFSTQRDALYAEMQKELPLCSFHDSNADDEKVDGDGDSDKREKDITERVDKEGDEQQQQLQQRRKQQAEGDLEAGRRALRGYSMHPVVSVGGRGGGLAFHRHDSSWLALVSGRKLWCFLSPHRPPSSGGARVRLDVVVANDKHKRWLTMCVQKPGELVFVPRGWWHATYNLHGDPDRLLTEEEDKEDEEDEGGGYDEREGGVRAADPYSSFAETTDDDDEERGGAFFCVGVGGLGESPGLHWEVAEGNVRLLAEAYDEALRRRSQASSLAAAAAAGEEDDDATARAGDKEKDPLLELTSTGKTLLHTAAYHGRVEVAEWLLERHLERCHDHDKDHDKDLNDKDLEQAETTANSSLVNTKDLLRTTPLHWAALRGHEAMCYWLVDHGAAPRALSSLGETPVDLAKRHSHHPALSALAVDECM